MKLKLGIISLAVGLLFIVDSGAAFARDYHGHRGGHHGHHGGWIAPFVTGAGITWLLMRQAEAAPRQEPPVVSPPPPQQYWYYCTDRQEYYPYVLTCLSPWVRIRPR